MISQHYQANFHIEKSYILPAPRKLKFTVPDRKSRVPVKKPLRTNDAILFFQWFPDL